MMIRKVLFKTSLLFVLSVSSLSFANAQCCKTDSVKPARSRLTLGGYGEAVASRYFYSDNVNRYSKADRYKDVPSRGAVDLPHVVLMLGYDFGHGWSLNTELEIEHGGVESAMEIEDEEFGEWEKEIERGGEVALEQFWLQKSFNPYFNIRLGHDIVPVGYTNAHHLPNDFFTVYRPEGENQILPCTWHQTGISLWGKWRFMRYQAMLLPGLNSLLFSKDQWIKNGSASAFEFTPSNKYAVALRLDFYPIKGLRIGLSGYYGESFNNTLQSDERGKYQGVRGAVTIGSADFSYNGYGFRAMGSFDYGHLGDAGIISQHNRAQSASSPYKRTLVGDRAHAASIQAGYDLLYLFPSKRDGRQKLYLFGTYENYDAYHPVKGNSDYTWTDRQRIAAGFNYYPMKELMVKGEYSIRLLKKEFNNEPSISLGVAYSGFFLK